MKLISELPRHGTDIYVVGSGSSLCHVRKDFFDGKVTIGINLSFKYFPITYGIANHTSLIPEMIGAGVTAITPEWDMGIYGRERDVRGDDYYVFKHFDNYLYHHNENHIGYRDINVSDFDNPDSLVIGGITSSAIHLAYKLGATSIILAGLDGGTIDGVMNLPGYYPGGTEAAHIYEMQPQIDLICNLIRSRGVGVYSLNPFTNFRLEGHTFKPSMV